MKRRFHLTAISSKKFNDNYCVVLNDLFIRIAYMSFDLADVNQNRNTLYSRHSQMLIKIEILYIADMISKI